MISSVSPSLKYSWSGSGLIFSNGRTIIDFSAIDIFGFLFSEGSSGFVLISVWRFLYFRYHLMIVVRLFRTGFTCSGSNSFGCAPKVDRVLRPCIEAIICCGTFSSLFSLSMIPLRGSVFRGRFNSHSHRSVMITSRHRRA